MVLRTDKDFTFSVRGEFVPVSCPGNEIFLYFFRGRTDPGLLHGEDTAGLSCPSRPLRVTVDPVISLSNHPEIVIIYLFPHYFLIHVAEMGCFLVKHFRSRKGIFEWFYMEK